MPPKRSAGGAQSPQTTSSGSSRRLKRPAEDNWDSPSEETDEESLQEERRRTVAWDPNLERGPTPSDPNRQSPDRSALRRSAEREALRAAELAHQLQIDALVSLRPLTLTSGFQTYSNRPKASSRPLAQQPGKHAGSEADSSSSTIWPHAKAQADFRDSNKSHPLVQHFKHVAGEEDKDIAVCMAVHNLRAHIIDFAHGFADHIGLHKTNAKSYVDSLCAEPGNAQLVRYIGCLAQGGPLGAQGWGELLADRQSLAALIVGIVGNALKKHVFSALWFGGTTKQTEELDELQQKQAEGDGEFLLIDITDSWVY